MPARCCTESRRSQARSIPSYQSECPLAVEKLETVRSIPCSPQRVSTSFAGKRIWGWGGETLNERKQTMTNTLHRHGSAESFVDDFIVFAIPARGLNDSDAVEKQRRFLEIAIRHKPVNIGDASHGAAFRP